MPHNPISYNTAGSQPFTSQTATSGGNTYDAYMARKAANPSYVPTKSGDMVGWIVENYGKEWLRPDGTAPDEAIWTYTGGEKTASGTAPKIGSVTGINYLPWNDKNLTYDPVTGQDYSRPQYANGAGGVNLPTGGYQGTPAELQADRDRLNYYRNDGTAGMNPAMMASIDGAALRGFQRESYILPNGSIYNQGSSVTRQDPMGRNATWSGPGGSWSEDYWGKPITSGIWKGLYPGQATMDAIARRDAGGGSSGSRPGSGGQYVPGGSGTVSAGQSPYIGLPPSLGQSRTQPAARGPWMQQMDNSTAMAAQMAQAAALRGGG